MRQEVSMLIGAALIACTLTSARASDEIAPLAERLHAASLVVDGEAGRPYTSWNGTDPATIVTYTPFAVHRVLKGRLSSNSILLREPGGEVGGASAAADTSTSFVEGERDVLLLGERDARDGSYSLAMSRGSYQVTRDPTGQDGLDIHLGVDAAAYPSRERGAGTPRAHVPLEVVERLARGDPPAAAAPSLAKIAPAPARLAPPLAVQATPGANHRERVIAWIAAALALTLAGIVLLRRRRRAPR